MTPDPVVWTSNRTHWSRFDALALATWTIAIILVFRDAVLLPRALFYFDITELNYPYRAYLFRELAAGRLSFWLPDLYCGLPLFSESQAGFFHPLKYLLYPWMATWRAFNLDTVLSVWLVGVGAYGWLRRHVGVIGALTGASIVGLGGYTWAHLIHTSMINALISVPFAVWALESAWDSGRLRAVALGAIVLAIQVFAGHLQDTILTGSALGLYTLIRALGEPTYKARVYVLGTALLMVALAGLISAVQWIPSKELLDRSPRAGGLTHEDLTYGSWHPQLLPALFVHEIYGTRARDTDWMDGFFPYHEMDVYMGFVGLFLAAIGARAWRDRWVGSWMILGTIGFLLMLGRFTFLMDYLHRVPILGSSRIPVRFHLWVTLAVAALAAVGADRLTQPGRVRIMPAVALLSVLGAIAAVITFATYWPAIFETSRWSRDIHRMKFQWIGNQLAVALLRNAGIVLACLMLTSCAAQAKAGRRGAAWTSIAFAIIVVITVWSSWFAWGISGEFFVWKWMARVVLAFTSIALILGWIFTRPSLKFLRNESSWRTISAALLPILSIADMAAAHGNDIPTVPSHYWADPPESVDFLRKDPSLIRIYGEGSYSSGEPGHASKPIDFMVVRETIAWSLPAAWDIPSTGGETPILSRRRFRFGEIRSPTRYDLEGLSHILSTTPSVERLGPFEKVGAAYVHKNPRALARLRVVGNPVYASDERDAAKLLKSLGQSASNRIVVETQDHSIRPDQPGSGTARIIHEIPDRVEISAEIESEKAFLLLADTFDPGWSVTVDGQPGVVIPANIAFRAVLLSRGQHKLVFRYRPAGFVTGLGLTLFGLLGACSLLIWPGRVIGLRPEHDLNYGRVRLPWRLFFLITAVLLGSVVAVHGFTQPGIQNRWEKSFHPFTWGAKIEAIKPPPPPME